MPKPITIGLPVAITEAIERVASQRHEAPKDFIHAVLAQGLKAYGINYPSRPFTVTEKPIKRMVDGVMRFQCPVCKKVMSRQGWYGHPCRGERGE